MINEETTMFDRALAICGNIDNLELSEFEGQADDTLFQELYFKKLKAFLKKLKSNYKKVYKRSSIKKKNAVYIFDLQYHIHLNAIEYLPKEISDKITDKRLFALGYATREVYETAKAYGEKLRLKIEDVINKVKEKEEELKSTFKFDYD